MQMQAQLYIVTTHQNYDYNGQEFNVDISNVPACKYLVTVKDDKRYLSPLKIIIL